MKIDKIPDGYIDAIARIEANCFTDAWSKYRIERELFQKHVSRHGVFDGERLVGYLFVRLVKGEIVILRFVVDKGYRRQRIGTSLMECLSQHYSIHKVFKVEVRASNEATIAFFENYGFKQVGEREITVINLKEKIVTLRLEKE